MLGDLAVFVFVLVDQLKHLVALFGVSRPKMKLGQDSRVLQPGTISRMDMDGKVVMKGKVSHDHTEFRIIELFLQETNTIGQLRFVM